MIMERSFFDRAAVEVAPDLLGCVLEHETAAGLVAVELTEVEAYMGEVDPASHAYRGRTARNAVMFGPPGHAYVYFTYGMHFCVNLVCLPPGTASAVLLRAGRVIAGEELACERRGRRPGPIQHGGRTPGPIEGRMRNGTVLPRELARGPARLCQALGIDRAQNGADVCSSESPLRITGPGGGTTDRSKKVILSGPRVGVSSGAEVAWRFWIDGEPTVSVYRPHVPRKRKPVTPRVP
jgi:DNA-3-methyladenine glycosylase